MFHLFDRRLLSWRFAASAALVIAVSGAPSWALDADSPFGVVAFIPSQTRWDAIEEAGIAWNRCGFSWRDIEATQGVYNWSINDNVVAEANARGLHVLAGLGYTPTWASSGGDSWDPPNNPQDFYDFIYDCVTRYKDSVHYWEIWNEPNLGFFWGGSRSQFVDLLKGAADAVHAADPTAKVVAPDLSSCCSPYTWLSDCLNNAGDKIDVISYHQYDGGDTPGGRLSALDGVRNHIVSLGYGSKPFWVTECGFRSDSSGMTEQLQGDYLVDMLDGMAARSSWWKKFFWYQIWEADAGEKYGLLYPNETPKPSWYAYRDYIAQSPWAPVPGIALGATSFDRSVIRDRSLSNDSFTVTNIGVDTLNYTITDDAAWLSVSPTSGTSTGESDTVNALYSPIGLVPGDYAATITVSDPAAANSPKTIAVVVHVLWPGDMDTDGDLDQEDFGLFQACLSGDAQPYSDPGCASGDFNGDGDVDQADFTQFELCMNGPKNAPACL